MTVAFFKRFTNLLRPLTKQVVTGFQLQVKQHRTGISLLCFHVVHKTSRYEFFGHSRALDVKEMCQRARCTCRAVVLLIQPFFFLFYVLIAVVVMVISCTTWTEVKNYSSNLLTALWGFKTDSTRKLKNVKKNAIFFKLLWYKVFVHWKLKLLNFLVSWFCLNIFY